MRSLRRNGARMTWADNYNEFEGCDFSSTPASSPVSREDAVANSLPAPDANPAPAYDVAAFANPDPAVVTADAAADANPAQDRPRGLDRNRRYYGWGMHGAPDRPNPNPPPIDPTPQEIQGCWMLKNEEDHSVETIKPYWGGRNWDEKRFKLTLYYVLYSAATGWHTPSEILEQLWDQYGVNGNRVARTNGYGYFELMLKHPNFSEEVQLERVPDHQWRITSDNQFPLPGEENMDMAPHYQLLYRYHARISEKYLHVRRTWAEPAQRSTSRSKTYYLRDAPPDVRELELVKRSVRQKWYQEVRRRLILYGEVIDIDDGYQRYTNRGGYGIGDRHPTRNAHNRYEYPEFNLMWDTWTKKEDVENNKKGDLSQKESLEEVEDQQQQQDQEEPTMEADDDMELLNEEWAKELTMHN